MDELVVFVVDDDEDIRATTRGILQAEGYAVETAANGVEALRRMRQAPPPALLLLDLMMPHLNGTAVLSELEAHAELSRIPVVVMTAATATPENSSLRYPMLRKPFSLDDLLAVVTTYVPRSWGSGDPPTDEGGSRSSSAVGGETQRQPCSLCGADASSFCPACGKPFCHPCLEAGLQGLCTSC